MTVQLFKGSGIQPYYLRLVSSKWNAKRAAKKTFAGLRLVEVAK